MSTNRAASNAKSTDAFLNDLRTACQTWDRYLTPAVQFLDNELFQRLLSLFPMVDKQRRLAFWELINAGLVWDQRQAMAALAALPVPEEVDKVFAALDVWYECFTPTTMLDQTSFERLFSVFMDLDDTSREELLGCVIEGRVWDRTVAISALVKQHYAGLTEQQRSDLLAAANNLDEDGRYWALHALAGKIPFMDDKQQRILLGCVERAQNERGRAVVLECAAMHAECMLEPDRYWLFSLVFAIGQQAELTRLLKVLSTKLASMRQEEIRRYLEKVYSISDDSERAALVNAFTAERVKLSVEAQARVPTAVQPPRRTHPAVSSSLAVT
jgi:hypothetical protein